MKKVFILLFLAAFAMKVGAQDFNSSQLSLRSSIRQFLAEEGFMPEIDSDGDIKFKKEGRIYYVSISSTDSSPMYLSLFYDFSYDEDFTRKEIERNANELNKYKAVKVVCFETGYSFRAEIYLTNADAFKYSFYKLMEQLASIRNELRDLID